MFESENQLHTLIQPPLVKAGAVWNRRRSAQNTGRGELSSSVSTMSSAPCWMASK
jgi:hypothetical protein